VDFFAQAPLRADAEAVADDQHPGHQFRIDGWSASVAVVVGEVLVEIAWIEMLINSAKEAILWDAAFKIEGIEKALSVIPLKADHITAPG